MKRAARADASRERVDQPVEERHLRGVELHRARRRACTTPPGPPRGTTPSGRTSAATRSRSGCSRSCETSRSPATAHASTRFPLLSRTSPSGTGSPVGRLDAELLPELPPRHRRAGRRSRRRARPWDRPRALVPLGPERSARVHEQHLGPVGAVAVHEQPGAALRPPFAMPDHRAPRTGAGRGDGSRGRVVRSAGADRRRPASIVETEDDPTPIVLILAATLRRAEETPKLAAMMRNAKGNVALRSTVDPQAATIRFGDGRVRVERGVAPDTDVTIATDVNRMADEDAPKPKVSGAATHARLALDREQGARTADRARGGTRPAGSGPAIEHHPRTPRGVHVVCTDEHSQITLGAEPVGVRDPRHRPPAHRAVHRRHRVRPGGARRAPLRGRLARAPRRAHRPVDRRDARPATVDRAR